MRLIDADALLQTLSDLCCADNNVKTRNIIDLTLHDLMPQIISDEPTVDAQPVKHGRWEWEPGCVGTTAKCSVCGLSPMGFYSLPTIQIGRLPEYPFCPKCGARMEAVQ